MRTIDQCFNRGALAEDFSEDGRGLGFSIGGWHPFRANTYLPTLKKLDPLANTSIGKAVWKPIEKVSQSVNKDFMKAKTWSQNHRKQLQIAAAVAAAAVGGMYAMGYLGTSGAAGAAGAGAAGAGEAVTTSAMLASETLSPLAIGTNAASVAGASGLSLVPAVVPTMTGTAGLLSLGTAAGTAATGGGILSTLGSMATSLAPLAALSRLVGGQGQGQGQGMDPYGYGSDPYGYGGGGGGGLGPMGPMGPPESLAPSSLPAWALPAAGGVLLLYLLTKGKK